MQTELDRGTVATCAIIDPLADLTFPLLDISGLAGESASLVGEIPAILAGAF